MSPHTINVYLKHVTYVQKPKANILVRVIGSQLYDYMSQSACILYYYLNDETIRRVNRYDRLSLDPTYIIGKPVLVAPSLSGWYKYP